MRLAGALARFQGLDGHFFVDPILWLAPKHTEKEETIGAQAGLDLRSTDELGSSAHRWLI